MNKIVPCTSYFSNLSPTTVARLRCEVYQNFFFFINETKKDVESAFQDVLGGGELA